MVKQNDEFQVNSLIDRAQMYLEMKETGAPILKMMEISDSIEDLSNVSVIRRPKRGEKLNARWNDLFLNAENAMKDCPNEACRERLNNKIAQLNNKMKETKQLTENESEEEKIDIIKNALIEMEAIDISSPIEEYLYSDVSEDEEYPEMDIPASKSNWKLILFIALLVVVVVIILLIIYKPWKKNT